MFQSECIMKQPVSIACCTHLSCTVLILCAQLLFAWPCLQQSPEVLMICGQEDKARAVMHWLTLTPWAAGASICSCRPCLCCSGPRLRLLLPAIAPSQNASWKSLTRCCSRSEIQRDTGTAKGVMTYCLIFLLAKHPHGLACGSVDAAGALKGPLLHVINFLAAATAFEGHHGPQFQRFGHHAPRLRSCRQRQTAAKQFIR